MQLYGPLAPVVAIAAEVLVHPREEVDLGDECLNVPLGVEQGPLPRQSGLLAARVGGLGAGRPGRVRLTCEVDR